VSCCFYLDHAFDDNIQIKYLIFWTAKTDRKSQRHLVVYLLNSSVIYELQLHLGASIPL